MKNLSVFDIIGPCMIGPSSSHTAGALRIALMARKLVKHSVRTADFILYGSFSRTYHGHGTDRALVGGILGFQTDDIRIKDSFHYAAEAGLDYTFQPDTETRTTHPNTVDVRLTDEQGNCAEVRGESIGGGTAIITRINDIDVHFTGEYSTIVIEHRDECGVLSFITRVLSEHGINIAFSKLFREEKGKMAYTVIEADERITPDITADLEKSRSIRNALVIDA